MPCLGIILDYQNRPSEAVQEYKAALQLKPDEGGLYNNLGIAYSILGDYERAVTAFQKAVRTGTANKNKTYNNLGFALCQAGRYAEARDAFKQGGNEAQAYNNLGYMLLQKGEVDQAISSFQKAVELSPGYYDQAAENLKKAQMLLYHDRYSGAEEPPGSVTKGPQVIPGPNSQTETPSAKQSLPAGKPAAAAKGEAKETARKGPPAPPSRQIIEQDGATGTPAKTSETQATLPDQANLDRTRPIDTPSAKGVEPQAVPASSVEMSSTPAAPEGPGVPMPPPQQQLRPGDPPAKSGEAEVIVTDTAGSTKNRHVQPLPEKQDDLPRTPIGEAAVKMDDQASLNLQRPGDPRSAEAAEPSAKFSTSGQEGPMTADPKGPTEPIPNPIPPRLDQPAGTPR